MTQRATRPRSWALSCAGDPIEVPATQEITLDPCDEQVPGTLWIAVKHIEVCCVPRTAQCPPDEDEPADVFAAIRVGDLLRGWHVGRVTLRGAH
jgi:hypothetical protein